MKLNLMEKGKMLISKLTGIINHMNIIYRGFTLKAKQNWTSVEISLPLTKTTYSSYLAFILFDYCLQI